jgi:hypothetical protein
VLGLSRWPSGTWGTPFDGWLLASEIAEARTGVGAGVNSGQRIEGKPEPEQHPEA